MAMYKSDDLDISITLYIAYFDFSRVRLVAKFGPVYYGPP